MLVCIALLFGWGWWSTKEAAKQAEERHRIAEAQRAAEAQQEGGEKKDPARASSGSATDGAPSKAKAGAEDGDEPAPEPEEIVLANDLVRFHFTSRGGALRSAELLDQPKHLDGEDGYVTLNERSDHGVGAFSLGPGLFDASVWKVESKSGSGVVFSTETSEGLTVRKAYRLPGEGEDPHELSLEISLRNDSGVALRTGRRFLYAGSASPLHLNEWSMQIGFFWRDGKDFEYKTVDHFGGKKVLGIFGKSEIPHDEFVLESADWAGVNDQFFATLVKPESPYQTTLWASRFPVVIDGDEEASKKKRMNASEAALGLPDLAMNPGDQTSLRYRIYLGPKEFARLAAFEDERKRIMHYDQIPILGFLFGWAIKPLASLLIIALSAVKGWIGSWGVAIILVTLVIRVLMWPVYAKSARSMKRMSKLTPLMKEIREKHQDDPQKMNEETMKLYRTYGVNPLGGCLPMFLQLPVFLAFYRMLWSAVELRQESFLWVADLSMPDTLFRIPGLDVPFNLLPILMAGTTFVQMAITPKTGDKTQQMVFMLMPFIFLFICYNFAAALSLYWTTSNLFSILQTWLTNKMPEPELTKRPDGGKKGFLARLQEQAEAQQRARQGGGGAAPMGPGSRTRMPGEQGARHTKSRKKKR